MKSPNHNHFNYVYINNFILHPDTSISFMMSNVFLSISSVHYPVILQASGTVLVTGGFLLLCDSSRILLSRLLVPGPSSWTESLPHPLFYYFSLGVICLGLILCFAGVIGCWAACLDNYCVLTVVSVKKKVYDRVNEAR